MKDSNWKIPHPHYKDGVKRVLTNCFNQKSTFPNISWILPNGPGECTFFLCCSFRPNAYRFFYDMVTRWLLPGRKITPLAEFAVDFLIEDQKYIAGEIILKVESPLDLELIQKNAQSLADEIRLGVGSEYQAQRILESKGLNDDQKTLAIQAALTSLIKEQPHHFDYDLFKEMQQFWVLGKEEFKKGRSSRLLARIICCHYLFRKTLKLSLDVYPDRRYISTKLIRVKNGLGITLAVSFIRSHEILETHHILCAVKALIPDAKYNPDSFFRNLADAQSPSTFYLEIVKEGGFSLEEERLLKEGLVEELRGRIEQRLHPVFMPPNEEEIMRHILTLAGQLRYVQDLPQVMIHFTQQTEEALEFLVIVLRIVKPGLPSMSSYFEDRATFLEYVPDRIKFIGTLRKKYKKEASVFWLKIEKNPFLREDHSIDLYKARQELSHEMKRLIGDFRDFNGGILSKETELFQNVRQELGSVAEDNLFLFENFFYSLNPTIMRSLLPVAAVKVLFLMLLDAETVQDQPYLIYYREDANNFYILLISTESPSSELPRILKEFEGKVASCLLENQGYTLGLILRDPTAVEIQNLKLIIENSVSHLI